MRTGKVVKNRQHKVKKNKTARRNAAHKAKVLKATRRVKGVKRFARS